MSISNYLRHGEQNAVSMDDLSRLLGLSSRACRKAVEAERLTGTLILSSERGYFLPGTGSAGRSEIVRFQRRTAARVRTGQAILRSSRRVLKKWEG